MIALSLLFIITSLFGQDTLYYMDGSILEVQNAELDEDQISFDLTSNGPSFQINTREIFMIRYASGERWVVDHEIEGKEEELGYDRFRYNGPKVGLTFLGQGKADEFLKDRGYQVPLVTQFGWQFETRLFTLDNETSGLLEWIFLVGGVEKGMFLPSASMIFGIREGSRGFELGMGPNLSLTGFGMAFAAGGSVQYGKINIPLNLAFVPSVNKRSIFDNEDSPRATGFRLSLLVGFNTRVE